MLSFVMAWEPFQISMQTRTILSEYPTFSYIVLISSWSLTTFLQFVYIPNSVINNYTIPFMQQVKLPSLLFRICFFLQFAFTCLRQRSPEIKAQNIMYMNFRMAGFSKQSSINSSMCKDVAYFYVVTPKSVIT